VTEYKKSLAWALAILAMVSPLIPILYYLGRPELTFQAICCAGALAIVVYASGSIRRKWWYWVTMVPIAGAHVLLILRVPWPKWVPAPVLTLLATVDAVIIFAILGLVEKLMGLRHKSELNSAKSR
jgi:O-antigen/teichoic acid export membrane protein